MSRYFARLFTLLLLVLPACVLATDDGAAQPMPAPIPLRCPAPSPVAGMQRADGLPELALARDLPASRDTESRLPVEISSDSAQVSAQGAAVLSGRVELRQGERRLEAEEVKYDPSSGQFSVSGTLTYKDSSITARGGTGRYDATTGASLEEAEFDLPERPARGAAARMQIGTDGRVRLSEVWFSTCPEASPDWRIRARSIELDTRTRNGTGRNAAVEFLGVPILYLPYISFPLGEQRKSGFLIPDIGFSSRSGLELAIPYYFNLAPNYDLLLRPRFYEKRGVDAGATFRYLTAAHRGEIRANLLPGDQVRDTDRHWLRLRHRTELPAGWRLDLDATDVSDAEYFEDFAAGADGTSTAFLQRVARLSYRDEHWRVRGEVQQFQTIDRALQPIDRPYAQLPRLAVRGEGQRDAGLPLRYSLDAEVVNFDRDTGVTGWRADASSRIALDVGSSAYYLRPAAGVRYTRYALDNVPSSASSSPTRSLPFAAIDAGLLLERPAVSGRAPRITLEPRLLYLWTPYREQDALPVFDTRVPDLNFVQLFRGERYVGADRVSDANQVSLGVTSRFYDGASGRQLLAATIGQTLHLEAPRVRLPNEPRSGSKSDLVAQLAVTRWQNFNVNLGVQWNPQQSRTERRQLRIQYRPQGDRAINLAYRFQDQRLEQTELSGAWPLSRRWSAFGRLVYDQQERSTLEQFGGIEYGACCWRLRVVGRRFVSSRTGERDSGIYLQLELNGLASVGSSADTFLEEAIRGYSAAGVSR
ncbi:MAG: LPS assembly protein LptD [Sinobacteraceae bacterium]|nr:LPS assembly protein LptD [Nevskiaceae bacterium]